MLFDAIADSLIRERFGLDPTSRIGACIRRLSVGYVTRIAELREAPCFVCKTHDLYENPPNGKYAYIFIYGDPLESVASVEKMVEKHGKDWFRRHQWHLKADGPYEALYDRDVLNYEGQLLSWLSETRNDTFCVEFDDLWMMSKKLSDFVGFNVVLPPRRRRNSMPKPPSQERQIFSHLRALKNKLKDKYESRAMYP